MVIHQIKKMKLFGFLLGSSMGVVIPQCKQVCTGTANNWENYSSNGIKQNGKISFFDEFTSINLNSVDISHCGFEEVSQAITSLTCDKWCWRTIGANNIYDLSRDSFQVYLWQGGKRLRTSHANNRNFKLNYEVIGNCPVTTTATSTTPTPTTTVPTTLPTRWGTLTDKITPGLATCGAGENKMTKNLKSPKIINGVEVNENSWPWIVGISSRTQAEVDAGSTFGSMCSGTIIDDRWILTAAHCCEGMDQHTLFIGDSQSGFVSETVTEGVMIADTVVIHPERANIEEGNYNFDACLLRTPQSIGIGTSSDVAAACLPTEGPKHGEACWVAGWGITETGYFSNELKSVGVNIFSDEYCTAHHYYYNFIPEPDEICAGLPDSDDDNLTDGGKDACQGDSGGPLVCDRDGTLTLTGIVSWGFGCAEDGLPGMYGDVFEYNDWIRETINNYN